MRPTVLGNTTFDVGGILNGSSCGASASMPIGGLSVDANAAKEAAMSPDANVIADQLALAAYMAVVMVTVFLGLRWGLGDTALRVGPAIAATLLAGALLLVLVLILKEGSTPPRKGDGGSHNRRAPIGVLRPRAAILRGITESE